MSNIEVLHENKWNSTLKKTLDNGAEYVYSSAPWCGSEGVAIVPFRVEGLLTYKFLGRYEICPAHNDKHELCSITGGMDAEGETPLATALRELEEEAGYLIEEDCMHTVFYLGTVRPSKASDQVQHIFAVDLDQANAKEVEATGDGSLCEESAYCSWITPEELSQAKDPLLHTAITRMAEYNLIK